MRESVYDNVEPEPTKEDHDVVIVPEEDVKEGQDVDIVPEEDEGIDNYYSDDSGTPPKVRKCIWPLKVYVNVVKFTVTVCETVNKSMLKFYYTPSKSRFFSV